MKPRGKEGRGGGDFLLFPARCRSGSALPKAATFKENPPKRLFVTGLLMQN